MSERIVLSYVFVNRVGTCTKCGINWYMPWVEAVAKVWGIRLQA